MGQIFETNPVGSFSSYGEKHRAIHESIDENVNESRTRTVRIDIDLKPRQEQVATFESGLLC